MSEYNKTLTKPKTLIGNWYEQSVQREKDELRQRWGEASDSTGFRRGKHRARYVNTTNGAIPIMRDDPDENEKQAMTNVQSLPDMLSHYETSTRVAEAPLQTTLRESEQRVKEFVAATHKPVPKRKMLKEEMLMREAMRQVLEEKQRQNLPPTPEETFQSTYKATACATAEQMLRSSPRNVQTDEPQIPYTEEEPVTFYSQAVDVEDGAATTVYHTKSTGKSRFGKSLGFSCPVEQYTRGFDKAE